LVFGLLELPSLALIEQQGTFLPNQATSHTAVNIGILTSLISQRGAGAGAFEIQLPGCCPAFPLLLHLRPSPLMVAYTVLYLLVALSWPSAISNDGTLDSSLSPAGLAGLAILFAHIAFRSSRPLGVLGMFNLLALLSSPPLVFLIAVDHPSRLWVGASACWSSSGCGARCLYLEEAGWVSGGRN
jgi:hypothetical protein